jgi:hypothetical protein
MTDLDGQLDTDQISARRHASPETLVAAARGVYLAQGIGGLAAKQLDSMGVTPGKLKGVGLCHAGLIATLGLTEEYAEWRASQFRYRGVAKPRWNWSRALEVAKGLVEQYGDLPTVQWCRLNGHSQLTNVVHRAGRTWEDFRIEIGLGPSRNFVESRNGMRWRSHPEASLSNFLYARGIAHERGERYSDDFSRQSGAKRCRYDLHFTALAGARIDVEIWGNLSDAYRARRAVKEAWSLDDPNFLGIEYEECASDRRLTEILEPFIGVIEPFQFDRPTDPFIETAHWSNADELLETCRQIAASMPDGVFPNEQWLRKRGRFADRPGRDYNTLSRYVQLWLGGTRKVRELLGQAEASTTKWTTESVVAGWQAFEAKNAMTPAQCKGAYRAGAANREVLAEGARIYEVARRLNVIDQARGGVTGRKVKWTAERAEQEWRAFCTEVGRTPSRCISAAQRERLPRSITDRATRVYSAARKLGILEKLRQSMNAPPSVSDWIDL